MPLPQRDYYKLWEVQNRWQASRDDMEWLALNEHIAVGMALKDMVIECGHYEIKDNGRFLKVPTERKLFSGLQRLLGSDINTLFRNGRVRKKAFRPFNGYHYVELADKGLRVNIRLKDLVVSTNDIQNFEKANDIGAVLLPPESTTPETAGFAQENDFHLVKTGEQVWHLGDIQARIIKRLYEVCLGNEPWLYGKTLLQEAGSQCMVMKDVFKHQQGWRDLIQSNGRGYYRLHENISVQTGS